MVDLMPFTASTNREQSISSFWKGHLCAHNVIFGIESDLVSNQISSDFLRLAQCLGYFIEHFSSIYLEINLIKIQQCIFVNGRHSSMKDGTGSLK